MRMINCLLLLCGLAGSLLPAGAVVQITATTRNRSTSKETVVVARGGVARLPVVIAGNADATTRASAARLIVYLQKITGATFTLKSGGTGPGIYVGTLADSPTPSATAGLKIFDVYDGREAYAIRTEGGSVRLLGATDLGVSHAVSRFLDALGYRWFFQSRAWEVAPQLPTITWNLNETDRPEVLARYFAYNAGQHFEKFDPDAGKMVDDWYSMNRVAAGFHTNVGHCAHVLVQKYAAEFAAHPEMRALIKDEHGNLLRTGTGPETPKGQTLKPGSKSWGIWGQLCVTNPDTIKLGIQYANEYFDKHPDADMVGVGPDDGGEWCLCPECAKLGNPGNQAFYFANRIAKVLQQSHPGKLVGLYAYNWHCDPPDFPLEPNVYVELTSSLLINTQYGFDQLVQLWPKKCSYFGVYDYWAVYDWIRDNLPSGRTGNTKYVAENLPHYIKNGISCLTAESGNSWGSQGLGYFLASRVLWNSSVDVTALKAEFYAKAFGPAAQAMKTYYEHVDLGNDPLVGPAFYRTCLDDLEAAEKAAAGHPDVLARIEQLKEYQVYVYLLKKQNRADLNVNEKKNASLQMIAWNYRIRNTYMTFWSFFADQTITKLSREFNEPTWNWYEMRDKREQVPYRDLTLITPEETAQRFQAMKAEYGTVPTVTEVGFSNRLVAPKWTAPFTGPSEVARQGKFTLALASLSGEPLNFSIKQGVMYPDIPSGNYVLQGVDGKEITRGETHKGDNTLKLAVPAAGVYCFTYDDHAGGSVLTYAKGLHAALVAGRGRRFSTSGDMWSYFYVPKGTSELQFYARGCGGDMLGIRDPNGRWIDSDGRPKTTPANGGYYFKTDGSYRIVPVPPGTDGAMWTLHCSPGQFTFFNIPSILALTPDTLILPVEVAKKDGLIK